MIYTEKEQELFELGILGSRFTKRNPGTKSGAKDIAIYYYLKEITSG